MCAETTTGLETHLEITVRGIVQGIGFRPFVFRLAERHGVRGYVLNHGRGVTIRAQAPAAVILRFLGDLTKEAPAAARIDELRSAPLPPAEYDGFTIRESEHGPAVFTQISPDLALCADCRRELHHPRNRRHHYPFTNCTQCGPRFTIIRGLPYDRPQTTMRPFLMCADCEAEYRDPRDRRFHAQPNACPDCGPTLRLLVPHREHWHDTAVGPDAIAEAARLLSAGHIVMIHGVGGFQLACDATNETTVRRLRERKRREEKPFAVMFPSPALLDQCCDVSRAELRELKSPRAPIVLVRKRQQCPVAPAVAPANPLLGVLLPYTPLHAALMADCPRPLVMTSANFSEEPIQFVAERALAAMSSVVDAALVHDRAIHQFADDSVVRIVTEQPRVWRRARGFVPAAVPLQAPVRVPTLAFGADLKNTFCIAKERSAILSQHLGDMQDAATIAAQQHALAHFLRIYDLQPASVACDQHPDYSTTTLAEEFAAARDLPLVRVQHHHAHLAACLAEHGESGPALALTLDGTGYGTDGTIWGGELLYGGFDSCERLASLETIPMPGNELAAREPWRMAFAWLVRSYPANWNQLELPLVQQMISGIGEDRLHALAALQDHPPTAGTDRQHPPFMGGLRGVGVHSTFTITSSLGRLFDAVAALTLFGVRRQYEGQAAMLLEFAMAPTRGEAYPLTISETDKLPRLSARDIIRAVVDDLLRGQAPAAVSARFHETVVQGYLELVRRAADSTGCRTVALSGGCFQNAYLLSRLDQELNVNKFRVLAHREIPTNDGGVALGQVCIANAQELH